MNCVVPVSRKLLGTILGSVLLTASLAAACNLPLPTAAAASAVTETRGEFTVQLAKALGLQPEDGAQPVFSDVPSSDPDFGYIMAACQSGWISGFPNGTFQPDGVLSREQVAKIEIHALDLQTQAVALSGQTPNYLDANMTGKWAWGYVNEATTIGFLTSFPNGDFMPAYPFTTVQAGNALSQIESYVADHAEPAITGIAPNPGAQGASVLISGTNFTGATSVQFGGTAASFTVTSNALITTVVPPGSGTVSVTVTTPNGSATDTFRYTHVHKTVPTTLIGAVYSSSDGSTLTLTFNNEVSASSVNSGDFTLGDFEDSLGTITNESVSGNSLVLTLSGATLIPDDTIALTSGQSDIEDSKGHMVPTSAPVAISGIPTLLAYVDYIQASDQLVLFFDSPVSGSSVLPQDLILSNSSDTLGNIVSTNASGSLISLELSDQSITNGDSLAIASGQSDILDINNSSVSAGMPVSIYFVPTLISATYAAGEHQLALTYNSNVYVTSITDPTVDFSLGVAGDTLGTVTNISGSGTDTLVLTLSGEQLENGGDTISSLPGPDILDSQNRRVAETSSILISDAP